MDVVYGRMLSIVGMDVVVEERESNPHIQTCTMHAPSTAVLQHTGCPDNEQTGGAVWTAQAADVAWDQNSSFLLFLFRSGTSHVAAMGPR